MEWLLWLKDHSQEQEWQEYRAAYLRRPGELQQLYLMEREGMWAELLEEVAGYGMYGLKEFSTGLWKTYPKQYQELYRKALYRDAAGSNKRRDYRHLVMDLRYLADLPGGQEAAGQMAAELRQRYPQRRVLLDELQKGGF